MTENEVLGKTKVPQSIGMGSYAMDSHNVQRYVTPEGYVQNEGDIGVTPEKPYQIDLGSVIPKREDCTNILVRFVYHPPILLLARSGWNPCS